MFQPRMNLTKFSVTSSALERAASHDGWSQTAVGTRDHTWAQKFCRPNDNVHVPMSQFATQRCDLKISCICSAIPVALLPAPPMTWTPPLSRRQRSLGCGGAPHAHRPESLRALGGERPRRPGSSPQMKSGGFHGQMVAEGKEAAGPHQSQHRLPHQFPRHCHRQT